MRIQAAVEAVDTRPLSCWGNGLVNGRQLQPAADAVATDDAEEAAGAADAAAAAAAATAAVPVTVHGRISRSAGATDEQECDKDESGVCLNPDAAAAAAAATVDEIKVEEEEEEEQPEPEDPSCPSRPHIIRCAAANLDVNKNNRLERHELQDAIDELPWLARGVLNIIGSVDKIMAKCDADGDDAISIDRDMDATRETCLATCFKRKAFKRAFFPDCDL